MYGWKFATRCRLFLLTLATMASYIRAPLLINSFCFSSCSMLAAPTWYRWRWSMTLPGMGQRGRPGAVAVSASVICRLDRWTCLEGGPSVRQSLYTRDHATWKKHHPDLIHRAVILLGGNDLVNLTEERLANPNTPRRHCHTHHQPHHLTATSRHHRSPHTIITWPVTTICATCLHLHTHTSWRRH